MRYFIESHSQMENKEAESYFLMASSQLFRKNYEKYIKVIRNILEKKNTLKILNIGFASATLEEILLNKFVNRICFTSIDRSRTFHQLVNKDFFKTKFRGKIKFLEKNVEEISKPFEEFDLILSRDLNHHLNSLTVYLDNCFNMLKPGGLVLMEDLRFDSDMKAIKNFDDLIFSIPELKKNNEMLFYKIIGLYESFLSSFTLEEVEQILKNTNFYWLSKITDVRYHLILAKNKIICEKYKNILKIL